MTGSRRIPRRATSLGPETTDSNSPPAISDIGRLAQAKAELRARLRQQAVVAELGQQALAGIDLDALLREAVAVVAQTLSVEYCKVLELLPDGDALLLRAGVGWREGLVGRGTVGAGHDSQAGYTLASSEPVIVTDLRAETRFSGPPLLHDHGVISGMSVIIQGQERPFGVMGAHATQQRVFTQDDIHFLQAVANVLASAIERWRAEETLRYSESRYRSLISAISQIVWTADPAGAVTTDLPAWREYTGQRPEEILGWGWLDAIHPDDHERAAVAWAQAVKSGTDYTAEYRLRKHDGSYRHFADHGTPILAPNGAIREWIGVCNDITDRRQLEDSLRFLAEASALLAASLDYETTLASLVRLAVPALADWCTVNILEEDAREGGAWIHRLAVEHVDPEKQALLRQLERRYRFNPEQRWGVPWVIHTGESSFSPEFDAAATPSYDGRPENDHLRIFHAVGGHSQMIVPLSVRGRTVGAITFVLSESPRHYTRTDLALAEDLARRAAAAVDNARLYREAQVGVRLRDEFLSIASHELRTPVASIKGYAQLLLRALDRARLDPDRLARSLRTIDEATDRLDRLTHDLLDVSRIRTGQLLLRPQPTNLSTLTEEVVARYDEQLDARHRLILELPADSCPVFIDADRLEQVLTNLIENAVKYSPSGGDIRVTVRPAKAAEAGITDGDGYLLSISDEGIGLAEDVLDAIFEPFGRAPNASYRQIAGLGLGLYICRNLVERHDGRIWAASAGEGEGTTLQVWLPAHAVPTMPTT